MIKTKKLISIIFSFRNEEKVIPELISRTVKVLSKINYSYEIIFINDNSDDGSLDILESNQKKNKNIKIINMSRRFGGTPCVLAGFRYAKGDALIYLDSDLQDPPELIPELIQKWDDGFDVVHTTREKRRDENIFKMWLTKKAYGMINFVSDIHIPKDTGDFKLYSRKVINEILELNEFDPFLRGLSIWVGYKQTFIYYEREARFAGDTKYPLFSSINPYNEFLRGITSFSAMPLYLSLLLGLIVSVSAFGFLLYILISRIFFGYHLPGWPALMVTMLFIGGMILFTIGVLGIYIGKIHQEIKSRPKYIVDNVSGFEEN